MAKPLRKQGKIKGKQSRVWWGVGARRVGARRAVERKRNGKRKGKLIRLEGVSVHVLVNTKLDIFIGIIREYLLAFEDVLPYPRAS